MTEMKDQPLRVLLATDGSDAARNAETWVSRARWDRPRQVDVLCVAGYGITRLGWSMEGDRSAARQVVDRLREAEVIASERTANAASLRLQQAGLKTRTLARHGDVAEEILATIDAERPDLVAIGPRGRSRLAQMLLGGVSRRVIGDSDRPVLVARTPSTASGPLPRSLLVPLDGTNPGSGAIEWLLSTGWAPDTHITLLGLLGAPPGVEYDEPDLVAQVVALLRDEAAAALRPIAERLVDHGSEVEVQTTPGHPVEATLQLAGRLEPDAIVVTRRRRRGGQDPFAEKVARYAETTVLLVPET